MKKFNVSYSETVYSDAIIKAETVKEAKKKLKEILTTVIIEDAWEVVG